MGATRVQFPAVRQGFIIKNKRDIARVPCLPAGRDSRHSDREFIITHMQNNHQKNQLLPIDSAGRIMVSNVPIVSDISTIADAENLLLKEIKNFETINYIYVVNSQDQLVGVISIKEVFGSPKTTPISQIMKRELIKVRLHTDQEHVAILAIKHNLKAIPVVDAEDVFLGAVPSDVILNVLHRENIEDVLRSAGVHSFGDPTEYLMATSATFHFKKRLPWLIVGTLGGFVAAILVGSFERILQELLVLAAFIPSVVYTADAVGSQAQMIFIRSLALNHDFNFKKYFRREMIISVLLAMALALLMSAFSFVWQGSLILSFILGLSFFLTIIIATATAILLPWFFYAFKRDPAIASGPLATIIRDVSSIVIYFVVASISLGSLVL